MLITTIHSLVTHLKFPFHPENKSSVMLHNYSEDVHAQKCPKCNEVSALLTVLSTTFAHSILNTNILYLNHAIKSSSRSILSSQPFRDLNHDVLAAALPLLLMVDKVW